MFRVMYLSRSESQRPMFVGMRVQFSFRIHKQGMSQISLFFWKSANTRATIVAKWLQNNMVKISVFQLNFSICKTDLKFESFRKKLFLKIFPKNGSIRYVFKLKIIVYSKLSPLTLFLKIFLNVTFRCFPRFSKKFITEMFLRKPPLKWI